MAQVISTSFLYQSYLSRSFVTAANSRLILVQVAEGDVCLYVWRKLFLNGVCVAQLF